MKSLALRLICVSLLSLSSASAGDLPQAPLPLVPGAQVIPLWPPDAPTLKGFDQKEVVTYSKQHPDHIQKVVNIHNPSIEVHLAPKDKANGTAIIVAAGGGNKELNVGGEGVDVAEWLNSLGTSAFILRYRLQPYKSAVDAVADTQRSIRMVRANAKKWNLDPAKIGVMGFSAGGEQAAWVALKYDAGDTSAPNVIDQQSDRPDFVVLVYAGWKMMDLSSVPKDAPPAFLTCAGVDDAFHAKETVEFYNAYFDAKIPAELHIYQHGGHGGGISKRKGIPYGTWQDRFVDWAADLKLMK